jgi:hypothetical protein
MYVWVELIYHLPLSFWAIGALIRGEIVQNQLCFSLDVETADLDVSSR